MFPVLYFAFWLILNARVTPEVIITGVIAAALASLLNYRFFGVSFATEKKIIGKTTKIFAFIFKLVFEVLKANIFMIKLILSPVIKTDPQIKYFNSPVRSELAQVALATAIDLTPGTVLVKLDKGRYGVHAINASLIENIENWELVEQLKKIEGGH